MSHDIVGKWRVTGATKTQKWIWEYIFDEKGTVRWRDPLNNLSGSGRWSVARKTIALSWAPKSTTKEYWYLPISPSFQTGEFKASYGNGTIVAERTSRGEKQDLPHFIKPSWASNSAGAKLTARGVLWRQELDLGASASIGLAAPKGLSLRMQNPAIAGFSEFNDEANDIRGIDLVGTLPGDSYFEAVRGDTVIAQMQVHVSSVPAKTAVYIDNYSTAYYDPDFRHKGGDFSKYTLLHFSDDVVVPVHLDQIHGAKMDAAAAARSIRSGKIGEGGRRYPSQMNATTTPRIYNAKQQAIEIMERHNLSIIKSGSDAVVFIVSLGPTAIGGPLSPRQRISRSKAPRSVRNLIEGGSGSGVPKASPAAIENNMVRLGNPGQAGNLYASIQRTSQGVVYRVDMIVLEGEGAEVATARATHREMLKRSAQAARSSGQNQFRMIGKQANPNFRAHADRLAREIGVPGSGKIAGSGGPGYPDYEIVLDASKVLAQ